MRNQRASVEKKRVDMSANELVPQKDDAEEREYSKDGVDLTLIRWMLSLNPAQRLQVLQENIKSIQELRGERPTV
jgi:hypothetical protein